jgi:DNA-binding NarL/FixJ family response regulator
VTGPDRCHDPTLLRTRGRVDWERQSIRVALYIADRALRAEIAETCEDADIAVAMDADVALADVVLVDVVLADRPVETAVPVIALVSSETRNIWPANVHAVVPADVDAATLVAIITVVAAGYALVPRKDLAGEDIWATPPDAADELGSALSSREREVLALLVEGASNKEIARALALSVHTVKFHIAALTEKLGARSRVEAVAIAIRAGLVMA